MKYGFIVPVYNHGSTLEAVVQNLSEYKLPIIIVDDGNDEKNREFINVISNKYSDFVSLIVHKKNQGKGAAVSSGIVRAHDIGLTHVLQIDSDGQHDAKRIKHFLEVSEKNPEALICGYPEYDETVPENRLKGRKIANKWVHIVCLSNEIVDAMIGFRVYPVEPYYKLIKRHTILDSRMGCDIDILVHLSWAGLKIISEPVKINYPADGVSNFRMVRDNLHIAGTFTRLCWKLLFRWPIILARNIKKRAQ